MLFFYVALCACVRACVGNATSHVWPLGALAELLDNSQDRECGSTKVEVDAYVLNPSRDKGGYCITVQDDGVGMDRSSLNNMLSFGFSDKEHVSGNVGRFGIGFKSGSMRLADDAFILTKKDGLAHCALLSQTFLDAVAADDILIPMFSWKIEDEGKRYVALEPTDATEWSSNMAIIENYCFTKSEKELLEEMDKIQGSHGTRVVLFNLRKRDSNGEGGKEHEFDFSVKNDIRMLGDTEDAKNKGLSSKNTSRRPVFQQHRDGQQATLDVPEDYSLRSYMEVLYLRPRCAFYLRGEKIVPRCPISRLTKEYYVFPEYKPKGLAYGITVHCGYIEENSKLCGFHIYNKNRLIRLYQRFASQLQANTMMKDMLGVIEADCLEPTHNKQAFKESDMAYHRMKKHVTQCMNDYYFGVQNLRSAGKNGRERIVGKAVTRPGRQKGKLSLGKKRKAAREDFVEDASGADTEDSKLMNAAKANRPINRYKAILQRLMTDKNAFPFLEKVDPIALDIPDYLDIISHPMDFGTIFKRLEPEDENGVPLETTYYTDADPDKFANDVRLVFANAFTYNKPDELVYIQAEKLAQLFEREWVYKFPASAYSAGGKLQPEMLKNKMKNLIETEKRLKKNAKKKRKKTAVKKEQEAAATTTTTTTTAGDVRTENCTDAKPATAGDVKTENYTNAKPATADATPATAEAKPATADANGEVLKETPMEVEEEELQDEEDDDEDEDEGPANPDDELNVQVVLDTYDDRAKKKWMEAQVEEVLEMKQKMRNQSDIVVKQQSRIADLEQELKDAHDKKRGSKNSKSSQKQFEPPKQFVDPDKSLILNQLNEARQQIIDQRLKIQKLQKAAQTRNGNMLNQAIQPLPAGLENLVKEGESNKLIRMDNTCIGVEQKELLQALHAATDKLEKQYTLLQLERQRAIGLEQRLKEEHERAQQIQKLIENGQQQEQR